jgi:hypothetical protein
MRLLARVRLLVLYNVIPLAKVLAADVALKRLGPRMDQLVLLVRAQIAEQPAARRAAVRLLARVRALMPLQILHVAKILGAHVTLERPLAAVDPLVAPQRGRKCKHFIALAARKWLVPGVDAHVLDEGALLEEALTAELALVRLDAGVYFGMVSQAVQPVATLAAHLTAVGHFGQGGQCVLRSLVFLQRASLPKRLAALCTSIGFLACVHTPMSVQVIPADQLCIFTKKFF